MSENEHILKDETTKKTKKRPLQRKRRLLNQNQELKSKGLV